MVVNSANTIAYQLSTIPESVCTIFSFLFFFLFNLFVYGESVRMLENYFDVCVCREATLFD